MSKTSSPKTSTASAVSFNGARNFSGSSLSFKSNPIITLEAFLAILPFKTSKYEKSRYLKNRMTILEVIT
ncbi:MAG: hypothetical protein ACTSPN_08055 [Promethearchaeota archaeon]